MLSKNFIESDFVAIKERQKSLIKHYERLYEIKKSEPKSPLLKTGSLIKVKPYCEIDRKLEISRNNKVLLEKIAHITKRKTEAQEKYSQTARNPKSLNLPFRKKEAERIFTENEQIAKRINTQKALITKKQFDKNFENFKKYRDQLSKTRFLIYQENCTRVLAIKDGKDRSITPALESPNFKIETNRSHTPTLCINTTSKMMANPMDIEDDSSYEDDFN